MASTALKKLDDELTRAMDLWTDLVAATKLLAWPSKDALQDIADSSATWQELKTQIEELSQASREVERLAKQIDDEIDKLASLLRDQDASVLADESLVVFLSSAMPERRYELVYECQKLAAMTERIREEGKVTASPAWGTQREKIQHNAERGLHGCEWQLDEITKTIQTDHGTAASAPAKTHSDHEAGDQQREAHEAHAARLAAEAAEAAAAAAEATEAKPAEEEPVSVAGAAASSLEALEVAAEAVSAPSASSSGDSDARVEEDVLDGM